VILKSGPLATVGTDANVTEGAVHQAVFTRCDLLALLEGK